MDFSTILVDNQLSSDQVQQMVTKILDDLINTSVERAITDKKYHSLNPDDFVVDNLQVVSNF
jgi:hypothetical protein